MIGLARKSVYTVAAVVLLPLNYHTLGLSQALLDGQKFKVIVFFSRKFKIVVTCENKLRYKFRGEN